MKIIGIVGILNMFPEEQDRFWIGLREAFAQTHPDAPFILERQFYVPWQKKRIQQYTDLLLEKYDTGEELLLIGHSMGGLIALTLAQRLTQSTICATVTIGSPFKPALLRRFLDVPEPPHDTHLLCCYGIFDPLVPFVCARHPSASTLALWSDHFIWFFLNKKPANTIAQEVARRFTCRS